MNIIEKFQMHRVSTISQLDKVLVESSETDYSEEAF